MLLQNSMIIAVGAAIAIFGISNTGFSADRSIAKLSKRQSIHCVIEATKRYGKTTLKGVVHSPRTVRGTYQLLVESSTSSGTSSLSQGGRFKAKAGDDAKIGKMVLGGSGLDYYATLTLDVDGRILTCDESKNTSI